MKPVGPMFKWFGSKWGASRYYPKPMFDYIDEPFAGGAGYSLRYHQKKVRIYDNNPNLIVLWKWLIGEATEDLIRDIPISIKEGTDIRTLGLSDGQAMLMKHWQRTNNVGIAGQSRLGAISPVSGPLIQEREWPKRSTRLSIGSLPLARSIRPM